jgi:RNase adapter protein RapZ
MHVTPRPFDPSSFEEMTAGPDTRTSDPMGGSALTDLVVITGFSGAGKSTAMAAFEDEGYFCVDNLPPEMIRSLVDLFIHEGSKVARAAVVSDARGGSYFEGLTAMLDDLRASGVRHRVLFLEADEESLLTRYKETRRRHPLAPAGSVAGGIRRERELLAPVRARADVVIDTGQLTAAMLRRKLTDELLPSKTPGRLAITFQSFGFKYGTSRDADLMFDVRFLPNPHYEPDLRPLTGADPRIVEYINRDGALDTFYARLHPLLDYLLPQYVGEGKAHLVVAIGCTGGRHRSVAIALHLAERYAGQPGYVVDVLHRDVGEPA